VCFLSMLFKVKKKNEKKKETWKLIGNVSNYTCFLLVEHSTQYCVYEYTVKRFGNRIKRRKVLKEFFMIPLCFLNICVGSVGSQFNSFPTGVMLILCVYTTFIYRILELNYFVLFFFYILLVLSIVYLKTYISTWCYVFAFPIYTIITSFFVTTWYFFTILPSVTGGTRT
jgi:hypothetical protein